MSHLLLSILVLISACSSTQTAYVDTETESAQKPGAVLIVYLSRTKNTKAVAEMIHRNVGGKLVAIEAFKTNLLKDISHEK